MLERLGVDRQTSMKSVTAFEQLYYQRFAKKRQRLRNAA
jgi:hypothetical protein